MSPVQIILAIFAFCLTCFGLLMTLGGLGLYFDPESGYSLGESIAMISLLGLLPTGIGLFAAFKIWRSASFNRRERDERHILQLAASKGGTLSLAEVTAFSKLDSQQVSDLMERLHTRGICEMRVAEGGTVVYHFPGFLSEEVKRRAEGY